MTPHLGPGGFVIIGAGGVGRETFDAATTSEVVDLLRGFLDDAFSDNGRDPASGLPAPLLGGIDLLSELDVGYVIAVGSGVVRRRLVDRIESSAGATTSAPCSVVDAAATIGSSNTVGDGALLLPGARLSNAITLGIHVQVHVNAVVGHDVTLSDYVSVFPNATIGGAVQVGEAATIGSGATVLPGVTIGGGATIGAGAVVVSDVAAGDTVVGVPARSLGRPEGTT